jgi:hypothetical protein
MALSISCSITHVYGMHSKLHPAAVRCFSSHLKVSAVLDVQSMVCSHLMGP